VTNQGDCECFGHRVAYLVGMVSGSDPSRFVQEQIESQRLILRELTLDSMRAIVGGDAAAAAPASPEYPPAGSLVGLRIRLEKAAQGGVMGWWFQIVRRADGVAIGDLNFHDAPNEVGEVVVGMNLVPSSQGCGLGTEALAMACAWALAQPRVRSVRGDIDDSNLASRRMAEKAGMRLVEVVGGERHYCLP
jgi:RimJ/RimL family protein N-acetyltransferase